MSQGLETGSSPGKGPNIEARLTHNIGAEVITVIIQIVFGVASSMLIVRGLPQTPVYEFYIYILIFAWANILVPVGIGGIDVALMKHIPEVMSSQSSSLYRVIRWACVASLAASLGIIFLVNLLLVWLPLGSLVPVYVVPFFQLALITVPLVAVSMILQGVFRGMQKMRFCAEAMGVFHGIFVAGLVYLFFTGTMNILSVIVINLVASTVTIIFEVGILAMLLRQYRREGVMEGESVSSRLITGTALQAFVLTMLGALFVNSPLLIANLFRTSDVIFAGLGLALGVSVYLHQGQAAPFRVLIPRVSGDVKAQAWVSLKQYTQRAWKLGLLVAAFVMVTIAFFANPVMVVFFAEAGVVAAPFLVLMTGSFLIYPLATMLMDTLIGLGKIRSVLVTYAVWNVVNIAALWLLCPLAGELVAALIWLVGLPFLSLLIVVFRQRIAIRMTVPFLSRIIGVLLGISLVSCVVVWVGGMLMAFLSLSGSVAWFFQIVLLLVLLPISALYFWSLIRIRVLDAIDVNALVQIVGVLDPISRPIVWFIKRLSRITDRERVNSAG
ncbi:MAG: hypothetical protein ACFE89_11755 [Candidatus Hodarchaeota archaeon]